MAMLPFCGYHMGDYFQHWLDMGTQIPNPPKIFHVNWFRQDAIGRYLWPGYGENVRALIWMLERIQGKADAVETAIGHVPTVTSLHLEELDMDPADLEKVVSVDPAEWPDDIPMMRDHFARFGSQLPKPMWDELSALEQRLGLS
jgi:phosphoenolpyruvate carboxykinase (GTP)